MAKSPARRASSLPLKVPAAVAALQAAITHEEALPKQRVDSDEEDEGSAKGVGVSLRQRAAPFIDQLQRSAAEGKDVVWGV